MPVYRGRFAPSPTGPLHFGSLFAAVISWAHARARKGTWHLRIEDIDPPREQSGAAQQILECLRVHGLEWDFLSYQSQHTQRYQAVLDTLVANGRVYACPCSRKQLAENQGRHRSDCPRALRDFDDCAMRFQGTRTHYDWQDGFRGPQTMAMEHDFIVRRRDKLWAYQLAVVADDHAEGITHVVRGADLLSSTPMQLALYEALNYPAPVFAHFPVITDGAQKLSKQNHAPAVDIRQPLANLVSIAKHLGLPGETVSAFHSPAQALQFILTHWQRSPILADDAICQADH